MDKKCSGFTDNILLCCDSYKVTHYLQYPPNTTTVYSYFESRGGKFDKTVFFGLQYIIKRWLIGEIVTKQRIEEAKEVFAAHFGLDDLFNEQGWRYIAEKHNGRLPVRIKAVPEGTVVPYKNVLFTVENTDPQCYWLTGYLETLLSETWYPMTVATSSYYQKKILAKYLTDTADNLDSLPFKLHDYGFRGTSSVESAGIGGAAHLVNFQASDTVAALVTARRYYSCNMAAKSCPGTDHSTTVTWGRDGEESAYRNVLEKFPKGPLAIVADSYNIYNACRELGGEKLKDLVTSRNGILYVRPDSGDPASIVCEVLDILGEKFGSTINSKGYKMLPPYLGVLQGDKVSVDNIESILQAVKDAGWSTENLWFGSGGALLQMINRDTQKCAYKCSYAVVDGIELEVYKEPVTDSGKKSKRGRLVLERKGDTYVTHEGVNNNNSSSNHNNNNNNSTNYNNNCSNNCNNNYNDYIKDELVLVFENGELKKDYTLDEIRQNAEM